MIIAAALMPIGLFFIVSGVPSWAMCMFGAMTGLGYGIIQPLIYDKTAEVAGDKKNSTLALSWVMIMNYIAIAISPFIIDGIRFLFKTDSNIFPFYLNTVLLIAFTIFVILRRNSFAFCIKKTYY